MQTSDNYILTCYFTGHSDPQRGKKWDADISELTALIESAQGDNLVILHDCFDAPPFIEGVEWIRTTCNINPYFERWVTYRRWLMDNRGRVGKAFCVDATDVQMLKSPFQGMAENTLYLGCEKEVIGCPWLINHHPQQIIRSFVATHRHEQLLNAGLVGGDCNTLIEFMRQIVDFYSFNPNSKTDMGALNYLAYTNWEGRYITGDEVCTQFKAYTKNDVSWWMHK